MSAIYSSTQPPITTAHDPLTTQFAPPNGCQRSMDRIPVPMTTVIGTERHVVNNLRRLDKCYPPQRQDPSYGRIFSPGLYCPLGFTANHDMAGTDFGAPRAPLTTLPCIPSGFTCPHSQLCTSLISAEFTAEALVTSYSTISGVRTSYIAGTSTATVTPPATIHADMVQLLYRASDIPDGFSNSPAHGARLSEYTPNLTPLPDDIITSPDWAGTKVLMAPGRDNPSAIAAGVGVSSVIVGLIALFVFRMRHKRNLKRAGEICQPRNPKPVWHQGNVPALPSFFAFPLGIISVLFGLQREWQEDMILRWGSKNAVLHFIQILSFFLRTCATALVWSVVVDCGWLLLASGMPALRFVGLWDMSAIGGSYMTLFSALWKELQHMSTHRWLLFLLLALGAICADWTGNALIFSTGVTNSTGSAPYNAAVPFTSIKRREATARNGSPELGNYIFTSSTAYPHILRHEESKTIAFLPVQAGDMPPSYYSGAALFGNMDTQCQLIPIFGNMSTTDGNYGLAATYTIRIDRVDLSSWKFAETPRRNESFNIKAEGLGIEMSGDYVFIDNMAMVVSLPWGEPPSQPDKNPLQSVHLFGVFRMFSRGIVQNANRKLFGLINGPWNTMNGTSTGTGYYGDPRMSPPFRGDGEPFTWEFQLCRTEVPYRVGIIETSAISRNSYPTISNCNSTVFPFCPNELRYRSANFTTTTWSDKESRWRLNATISDKNTAWRAIEPFNSEYILNRSTNNTNAVVYCHTCTAGRLASKHFAQLVTDSNGTVKFAEAFGGSILHAISATYRAQLPFFEGIGSATWTVPREVILVVKPLWLWVAVGYTWFMAVLAVCVRAAVLKRVGVDRSGSVIAAASIMVEEETSTRDAPPGPLKPLIERGYMHGKNDFEMDMEEEKGAWKKEMKLGIRRDGTFGIGWVDEVRGLRGQMRRRWKGRNALSESQTGITLENLENDELEQEAVEADLMDDARQSPAERIQRSTSIEGRSYEPLDQRLRD